MREDVTRMRALASEIATLERKYRACTHRMQRAYKRFDRESYESAKAAREALGNSEAAVNELAELLRTWGISVEDLLRLDMDGRTVREVRDAFEGWEVGRPSRWS